MAEVRTTCEIALREADGSARDDAELETLTPEATRAALCAKHQ
jgi:hypothetical protein